MSDEVAIPNWRSHSMINALGREVPDTSRPVYRALHAKRSAGERDKSRRGKLLTSIRSAIEACGLQDGDTISFHHHLRNGDAVLNLVVAEIAAMELSGISIAASSIFPVHAPLIRHMQRGTVTGLSTPYVSGPVGEAISLGALASPIVMYTHGGRARAIESGELHIDVAFVAASAADCQGNINGTQGRAACGTLGYPMVDVRHADRVVVLTDSLLAHPLCPADITQDLIDFVVVVDSIGDPDGIMSGSTRPTSDPLGLQIATTTAGVIGASGLLVDGFSFQTGAGRISLAAAASVAHLMRERGVQGSFASGGITGYLVDMLEAGLFRSLLDVQCFDLKAVESYRHNAAHQAMSASLYANPHNRGAVVNQLDTVILGAAEIDLDFNVNVTTASNGLIIGGSGGHSDTAAGAKLAIVTSRLTAAGHPKIVERVRTISTPGDTIDVLVTEVGLAVNPKREELAHRLKNAGLPVVEIEALKHRAAAQAGHTKVIRQRGDRIAALIEYRDGSLLDAVHTLA